MNNEPTTCPNCDSQNVHFPPYPEFWDHDEIGDCEDCYAVLILNQFGLKVAE